MKFAISIIISLVQSAAIAADNNPATSGADDFNDKDVPLISDNSEEITDLEVIPDWLLEFKDFMDADELDFNFESYVNQLNDEQTDELFYLISLMIAAGENNDFTDSESIL